MARVRYAAECGESAEVTMRLDGLRSVAELQARIEAEAPPPTAFEWVDWGGMGLGHTERHRHQHRHERYAAVQSHASARATQVAAESSAKPNGPLVHWQLAADRQPGKRAFNPTHGQVLLSRVLCPFGNGMARARDWTPMEFWELLPLLRNLFREFLGIESYKVP